MYLKAVRRRGDAERDEAYPFSVPAIMSLERLTFDAPVTFFAGENGTGKSTLLEAIAAGAQSTTVRGDDAETERTLESVQRLSDSLKFEWVRKTHRGFFLRSEDFFDYAKRIAGVIEEFDRIAGDFGSRLEGYGKDLAVGATQGQRARLIERYGEDLNRSSHGEGFLRFFGARFVTPGLYLLDEPDTALSAQSVLALLAMIGDMVREGAQFIIATHSPMLLAFPNATILSFDRTPVAALSYEDVEQVALWRQFLERPYTFTRHL